MMGRTETLVGVVGALLLASASGAVVFAQAPATKAPAAAPAAAPLKFVTPFKGAGTIEILAPQVTQQGNLVVTKVKIKNLSKGPLVGFEGSEYWYNAKGETVSGSQRTRHPKAFMPNEVIELVLTSPKHADMNRVLRTYKHANGTVDAKQVAKFKADS